jgi:hypothetical protein
MTTQLYIYQDLQMQLIFKYEKSIQRELYLETKANAKNIMT